ncbi:hypothetical protein BGZ96_007922 [Linnemannia gamsii]|uniref:Ras-GEF domain-containing protein n=1 Tax=Linnemannia gamsii TaxID=64522 RepID=A0ABQ7JZD6_9FUNG|nr:hypothetical protein BGZ96_007922 [Linnemannia gamsii]
MGDCHSTLQHSRQRQQNTESEPASSSSAHPRLESSPAGVAAAWVLPPIPTFEELGLRFDRSRTSSMNAITEGERLRAESQQHMQMQDIHRGVTNALLQAEHSRDNGVFESGSGCPWSSGEHAIAAVSGDDNVAVMPDMIPDNHHPSIFDDILSDDNEAYIIWSTPSTKTKPSFPLSTAGPSSSGGVAPSSVAALSEPVKQHPTGSDASSASAAATTAQQQHHHHSSSLDKGTTSAGQDRSQKKRWSTIEPLNVRIKEANLSTDTLQLSLAQPKPVKQEGGTSTPPNTATGNNLRPPKTATTATTPNITTAAELQQKNRVIMAATAEKLVEKLTSEIVRIRTFVTLRHWLLNYFEFDFMRSKDLRQTLGLYLRSLTSHPRVTSSMREQRIVKELRRYVQSLKTIHYRRLAQQKLEKQSRRQQQQHQQLLVERRKRLQARRSSAGRRGSSFMDRPVSGNVLFVTPHGQPSSNRSSVVLNTASNSNSNRQSGESEALTEVLTVEFRSSDQSDDYDDMDEDDYFGENDEEFYDEDGVLYEVDQDYGDDHGLYSGSGDSTEDDNDDGFEESSENSLYDSEDDSEYSDSAGEEEGYPVEDNEQGHSHQQPTVDIAGGKKDAEVEGLVISSSAQAQEEDRQSECHLPSPAFSPRSGKAANQGGSGSFGSRLGLSAGSSAASRVRARGTRPGLPDFQAGYNANNSKVNPSPLHQTSTSGGVGTAAGAGSRRGSRATKSYSRPLSTFQPLLSPPLSVPLSPRGSMRSVEPYMNPPPRSVASIEKKKPWFRYMSATVGRLSKMKRVFTSNAYKNDGRPEEGGGGGGNGSRSHLGAFGRTRSDRYWQGNLSDPEGEKVSYLLACPGMNILLSNSEDRHHGHSHGAFGRGGSRGSGNRRRGGFRGGLNNEDGRSGWSSEGDYSQFELTRQRNQEMLSNVQDDQEEDEEEPNQGTGTGSNSRNMSVSSPFHDRYQQRNSRRRAVVYELESTSMITNRAEKQFRDEVQEIESFDFEREVGGGEKSVCSECEREQYFSSPAALQRPISLTIDTPDEDEGGEEGEGSHTDPESTPEDECHCQGECECDKDLYTANFPLTSSDASRQVPHLRRTDDRGRRARNQRASWMTLSSTTSSMFGQLLNGNHLPPRQAIRQKGTLGNVDRFVERLYNNQAGEVRGVGGGVEFPGTVEPLVLAGDTTAVAPVQGQDQGAHVAEPASIHPLAADTHPVGPLTPVIASFNNNQVSEGSFGLNPLQLLPDRPTNLAMNPGRSNSQPNLLTTFPSDTVALQVLRYSSELIAQQLCLIEREMLSQVQWYELVDAGWTKKKVSSAKPSTVSSVTSQKEPESKGSESSVASSIQINEASLAAAAGAGNGGSGGKRTSVVEGGGVGKNEHDSVNRSEGTVTPTPRVGNVGGGTASGPVKGSPKVVEDTLGIKRLVDRFNLTCQWVTSEIVRTRDLQERVKVVEKFIRIAHTCYNHSNFSSLIQLMLGLQSHSVSRLNQTWARVRAQEMRIMEDLVEYTSPFHNWKHLRDDMKSIADEWGGSNNSGGAGAGAATATTPVTEKVPPSSGGTTASSFFGKRRASKDSAMAIAAAAAVAALQYKGTASSSGLGSKVSSSIAHANKEKELKMGGGQQQEKDSSVAKASQPKGCIPFLGLYLSDLVFNAELPSYVDPTTHNNINQQQQQQQQSQASSRRPSTSTAATATSTAPSLSLTSKPPTISSTNEPTTTTTPPPKLLVNIHKHRTTATIIKRILTFKTLAGRYPFEQDPDVRQLLMAMHGLDPAEISRLTR